MTNRKRNKRKFNLLFGVRIICAVILFSVLIYIRTDGNSSTSYYSDAPNETQAVANLENTSENNAVKCNKKVPVLCFHSIDNNGGRSPLVIPVDKFKDYMQTIKNGGYNTITMQEFCDYLFEDKEIPDKSIIITFDDGYMDNYTNVFPILKELNMKATMFIISDYLDGKTYMTPDMVKELSDSGIVDIESHTCTHRRLGELSYDDQYKELKDSKDKLEKLTGKEIVAVAYPEGNYNYDTRKALDESGYGIGFTTKKGYAGKSENREELDRICIDYTYKDSDIMRILN